MTLDSIEMKHNALVWEVVGIAFVFLVGSLLHFVFEWSGESRIVGLFASVNESVWEHFKQGFWPVCIWGAIDVRLPAQNRPIIFLQPKPPLFI